MCFWSPFHSLKVVVHLVSLVCSLVDGFCPRAGVGFLLGNEELRDQVQKTLDAMAADGTFMKIATEWGLEDSVCLGK